MTMPSAEYMREWREKNPGWRERQLKNERARNGALRELSLLHPREFQKLLIKHRRVEGLE